MQAALDIASGLLLYVLLTLATLGWGRFFGRLICPKESSLPVFDQIWLGWGAVLLILQALHFFAPINGLASSLIYVAGIFIFLLSLRPGESYRKVDLFGELSPFVRALFGIFALLVIWRSLKAPTDFDTGLYHLDALRWINQYAVVPGLGNFYDRLAFNYSYFPFVASLNFYPFYEHGYTLAFGWIVLLLTLECLQAFVRVLRNRDSLVSVAADFIPALLLPYLLSLGLATDLSSPQPNRAAAIIRLILFVYLWRNAVAKDQGSALASARMILVLGVTAVTLKISNVAFAGTACVAVLLHCVSFASARLVVLIRELFPTLLLCATIALVWTATGVITSGYPLYPATVFQVHTDWTVDPVRAKRTADWIYSWARLPHVDPNIVLANGDWFRSWLHTYSAKQRSELLLPALLCGLSLAAPASLFFFRRFSFPFKLYLILLVPCLASLILWFKSAPDPRFMEATLWLVLLGLLVPSIQAGVPKPRQLRAFAAAACVMSLPLLINLRPAILGVLSLPLGGWEPLPTVAFEQKTTDDGLVVWVPPMPDQQSWGNAFPSTPYFFPGLQRRGVNPQSGFKTLSHLKAILPDGSQH